MTLQASHDSFFGRARHHGILDFSGGWGVGEDPFFSSWERLETANTYSVVIFMTRHDPISPSSLSSLAIWMTDNDIMELDHRGDRLVEEVLTGSNQGIYSQGDSLTLLT